ncbi:MAG TPA: BTAD domain-containing putative transcriptional regulator [Gaiellaceae bacterium]|nr:BTAD domain-containing putative transcriptional regulator [Gaiellaceae bacterium]
MRQAGEPLELGGSRPRALLALLALNRSSVVSSDRIVEELWGDESPASARHMVAVYVSRLRKRLGEDIVLTRRPGYQLQVGPEQVDAARFERLLAEGREALADGDSGLATARVSEALALWRGPALVDFAYEPFAQAEIARLEELRLQAEEERIDGELALGRGAELVPELENLVTTAPLRERRRAQHMLALYRSGRQADALAAYQEARLAFGEELGIEPGPELRELERRILEQDEGLLELGPSASAASPQSRRTVTVVVAELLEAAGADPESGRAELERVRETVARYGGSAGELPDGAVLAVFGSPVAHEDDCVRAVRAAAELRSEGVVSRAGIETGEVLAALDATVRGTAVRTAARLKETAQPGEIALGESTGRLVGDAARLEPRRAGEDQGLRLLKVVPDAPARPLRLDAHLVGRASELAELRALFARAVGERKPQLVTVAGEPGIGKTRLARELGEALAGEAHVLQGRCLAYGEGMTYWPLREIVRRAAGSESRAAVLALLAGEDEAEVIADGIASVLGDSESAYPVEEIRWAAQRLLARLSREQPLLVVIDDVHWAEPTLVDLIEHVVAADRVGPVLVLCLARPEFLESRPDWAGESIALEALSPEESAELLGLLAAGEGAGAQIVTTASGNPLFLEQLAAFAAERWSPDRGDVPPTLRSLLAARLDGLGPGERAVVERAAVIGREFWAGAVADLLPPQGRATLPRHLEALARKGLTEADASPAPFEQAFHFRHVLIQEAAYRSLPKGRRAELHERAAGWLEHSPPGLTVDTDQVVGFHLERAYGYRSELGPVDDGLRSLGERAGDRLAAAGRRALEREDAAAAVNLLERALALPADRPARPALSLRLAEALDIAGEAERAYALLGEAVDEARSSGDRRTEWLAAVQLARMGTSVAPAEWSSERVIETATRALEVFEELGDDLGLARAWTLMAEPLLGKCRLDEAADRFRRALRHAERTGDEREVLLVHDYLHRALYFGSAHVSVVRAEAEAMLARAGGRPRATTFALLTLAGVQAMSGEEDESRRLYLRAKAIAEEVGLGFLLAMVPFFSQEVGLLFGDAEFAEREARAGYERLEAAGDKSFRSTMATVLAEALLQLDRREEAEQLAGIALALASVDDVATQARARAVHAKILAAKRDFDGAERVAREALEHSQDTDDLDMRAFVLLSVAEVLRLAGRDDEAKAGFEEAAALSDRKGNVMTANQARTRLAEL